MLPRHLLAAQEAWKHASLIGDFFQAAEMFRESQSFVTS